MTVIDRYLLRLFCKIFVVCFASLTGLFVVIHVFTNLDELISASQSTNGLGLLLLNYYSPRVLDIFNRMVGMLVLISGIFALGMMQRRRELTAVQAAGIAKSRLVRPVLIASLVILVVAVVNRELVLPQFREQLVQTPSSLGQHGKVAMIPKRDPVSGLNFRGKEILIQEKTIVLPEVQLPLHLAGDFSNLQSESGTVVEAGNGRPAGLLLEQVTDPEEVASRRSIRDSDGNPVVVFPGDCDEFPGMVLGPRQCFVVCDLDVQELAFGQQLDRYKTIPELMAELRQPQQWFGQGLQVNVHARLLQPILDMTLVLLGLPLVIGRLQQNIFSAAGLCLLVVIGVQVTTLACHNLGASSLIRPPPLAAWLPLMVFLPFAVLSVRRIDH